MTFSVPVWVLLSLLIALFQAFRPLAQERWRGDAFGVAVGNKLVIALLLLPFVLWQGLPHEPLFYTGIAASSLLWCVSDIYYFRAVEQCGAGPVSRILPGAIVISFLLWFILDPTLLPAYLVQPWRSCGIALCMVGAALCSMRLSRCPVSRAAFRAVWPTLLAATVGPSLMKLILTSAPAVQTVSGYAFVEALTMLGYWTVWGWLRRLRARPADPPHPGWRVRFDMATLQASLAIGTIMAAVLALRSAALLQVDNPAYVTVLAHTDVLWIVLIYHLRGKREDGRVLPGLGIVACAATLALLKSL